MKSIITKDLKTCYNCGRVDSSTTKIEIHHCIHGTAGRKLATQYHLVVGLCSDCHRGTNGVHGKNGHELDLALKRTAQEAWENKYGDREKFIQTFGRSYIID